MPTICLSGASLSTGNLGVSALSLSVLSGILRREPNTKFYLLDHGRGERKAEVTIDGREHSIQLIGSTCSLAAYREESLIRSHLAATIGWSSTSVMRAVRESASFLDITGGDSFTDLYGARVFYAGVLRKYLAARLGTPLILLPQTYGPFQSAWKQRIASSIVRSAKMAWARDEHSYKVLSNLLCGCFDPAKHCCGVDVAFSLPAIEPDAAVSREIDGWIAGRDVPLVGINVSGLLMNNPEKAATQYGHQCDYVDVVLKLVRRFLLETESLVLLVPHVIEPTGHPESDIQACLNVADAVNDIAHGRVKVLPTLRDPRQLKAVVARCDWFCGTRMHSTIASLSSCVPTATLAYSGKAQGVFESCKQGAHVADMRALDTEAAFDRVWQSWLARKEIKAVLESCLAHVLARAESQMDEIVAAAVGCECELTGESGSKDLSQMDQPK